MSIKTITTDDLRRMNGKEGLVLQGCGPVQGYYLTLRGVGALKKHAGGMFLVPISAAMPP